MTTARPVETFPGRLAVLQRVLPIYRAPFFDLLSDVCQGGLSVYAGAPRPEESIELARTLEVAEWAFAENHFLAGGRLLWQVGITGWLKRWNPQALIVEANPRYLSTPFAIRWMKSRRRPVIGWGLGIPISGGLLRSGLRRLFLSQFDALVTYSQSGAEQYRAAGFPANRIFVAPNAAAPRPTTPPPARLPAFDGAPMVLFVGRLQARKRIDNLLRACAALPPDCRPRLCIVGDGPARPELEVLAREVYPSAQFLGAHHGPELGPIFDQADIFVLPGTGGLAVQQAMAHALPVIAAEADGTQNDLVRPENGWQVAPGDLESLTSTLLEALQDAARLRQMGSASYYIVSEEINLERMVAVLLEALKAASAAVR